MNSVRRLRLQAGTTQTELARRAGTSQPTVAAYEAGTKSPSLRTLTRLALAVDRYLYVDFTPPLTREDRRTIALHTAIATRLQADPDAVLARAQTNLAKMRRKHRSGRRLFDLWKALLNLRHVTPFAGVLTAPERASVYQTFAHSNEAA